MLVQRMIRAAALDSQLYEEVEANSDLDGEAATVVAIVALCQGLGSAIGEIMGGGSMLKAAAGLLVGIIVAFVGWFLWSWVTHYVGTSMFQGKADLGEMLRTLGFAQTPGILMLFSFVPVLGILIGFVTHIWSLVAGIIAIRQAMDFTTGKAVLTAIVGWFVQILVLCGAAWLVAGNVALLKG